MCGIFGLISSTNKYDSEKIIKDLLILSQSRGRDSSGLVAISKNTLTIYKKNLTPTEFIKTEEFKNITKHDSNIQAFIGHSRMETNGSSLMDYNNQPIVSDICVTVHNGIIVNDTYLFKQYFNGIRKLQVDTEIINALVEKFIYEGMHPSEAYLTTINNLRGSYSTATTINNSDYLYLATNTGSLYLVKNESGRLVVFLSEKYFADIIVKKYFKNENMTISQVEPGTSLIVNVTSGEIQEIKPGIGAKNLNEVNTRKIAIINNTKEQSSIDSDNYRNTDIVNIVQSEYEKNFDRISKIKRCTRCILPETMPFIKFNNEGVCNYCLEYSRPQLKRKEDLDVILSPYRKNSYGSSPNCLVAFSGGRDSSYSLHYIKKELGMKPLAFSYDWGMLTDLGRRNQARMLGSLGIEQILISADIKKKRGYIKENIQAWMKKPHLGTIPLFMAGDKQYFYYANMVRKKYGLKLLFMGENYFEKTAFKNGFADIQQNSKGFMAYHVSAVEKIRMLYFYLKQYAANPSYINNSLIDTLGAYISYFLIPHKYINIYDYVKWDEQKINSVLKKEYDWEVSPDTDSTWRIGDGTASFYNYIYYTVAGFTENDTFRSNQVRAGEITREDALRLVNLENKPRTESLKWYFNTINLDAVEVIKVINNIEKLYK